MASLRIRRRIRTLSVLMVAIVVAVSVIGGPLAPSASAAPVIAADLVGSKDTQVTTREPFPGTIHRLV